MALKDDILSYFEKNRDTFIKGSFFCDKFSVSRNAVSKAVKNLKEKGYKIEIDKNKGYCFLEENNILSAKSIEKYLKNKQKFDIEVFETIDSTNIYAKKLAQEGVKSGKVIIAYEQTAGRGRYGKTFYSPKDTGIYFSIVLRPELNVKDSLFITTGVAICVARAIEKVCAKDVKIKWVNDIFVDDKKVCGISNEAGFDFVAGLLEYVVIGIGINISTNNFPDEIKSIAGSINSDKDSIKEILISEILNNIDENIDKFKDKIFLDEYKKRSYLTGKDIFVIQNNEQYPAKALDIDDNFNLIVQFENGEIKKLSSNEVSTRRRD